MATIMATKKISHAEEYDIICSQTDDPRVLLRMIVEADRHGWLGHDPYFADLKKSLLDQAERLMT